MVVKIDTQRIQAELQELAGKGQKVKVQLDRHLPVKTSIHETDQGVSIKLNPKAFRSPAMLEEHLNWCRESVGGAEW